jgi:hypothetical protein
MKVGKQYDWVEIMQRYNPWIYSQSVNEGSENSMLAIKTTSFKRSSPINFPNIKS